MLKDFPKQSLAFDKDARPNVVMFISIITIVIMHVILYLSYIIIRMLICIINVIEQYVMWIN